MSSAAVVIGAFVCLRYNDDLRSVSDTLTFSPCSSGFKGPHICIFMLFCLSLFLCCLSLFYVALFKFIFTLSA